MLKTIISGLALCLAAIGCTTSGTAAAPTAAAGPSWKLEGTRLIGCCCATPCSCRLNKPPMQAHGCEYTTAVHIDKGHIGNTRMDGLTWFQVGLGFAEDKGKNWVVVYVDDKATEEQFKALQEWMSEGMKGINEKKLGYLAGAFVGFKKAPVVWEASKKKEEYRAAVGNVLDLKVKFIRNPGHPEPVTSAGVLDDFGNSFTHCDTLVHTYKDPSLKYDGWDLTGRQSNHADFVIGSDLKTAYAIGWGCWSGHEDFGAKDKYQERQLNHPKK